jgi:Transposase IS116/IS110/IS902 family
VDAPPAVREVRELLRYRAKLVQLRSGLKAQVHAVMGKEGVLPTLTDMFCAAGQRELDRMDLGDVYVIRVESLRDLIEVYDREVRMLERKIDQLLRNDRGYQAIQVLNGVGRTIAAIFVAEIGDVHRFAFPEALCSWAGLAPRHRESDIKVVRGGITKMGRGSCVGPRSKASPATTAAPGSSATSVASPTGAARTKPASRWLASSSRSSTTACATARSAALPNRRRREHSDTTLRRAHVSA